MLRSKEIKYISKWGNKSKVGAIINDYNTELLESLHQDNYAKTSQGPRQSYNKLTPNRNEGQKSTRLSSLPTIEKSKPKRHQRQRSVAVKQPSSSGSIFNASGKAFSPRATAQGNEFEADLQHFVTTNNLFNSTL